MRTILLRLLRIGPQSATAADGDDSARLGLWGERLAARHLESRGYRIVGRRVRMERDELDLVAVTPDARRPQLVFVEVKTRRSPDFGGPMAALNRRKRHALCRAAARYLRRLPPPTAPFRFDAVEVIGDPGAQDPPLLRHTENVFPMESRYVESWLSAPPFTHASQRRPVRSRL